MKIAFVGSRIYPPDSLDLVRNYVRMAKAKYGKPTIVSGHAWGVDRTAEEEALRIGLPVLIFPADWSQGKGAGMSRNTDIVNAADIVIAFWDGASRGTKDTITKAQKGGRKWVIVYPDGRIERGG